MKSNIEIEKRIFKKVVISVVSVNSFLSILYAIIANM